MLRKKAKQILFKLHAQLKLTDMKKQILFALLLFIPAFSFAQKRPPTPDKIYGDLFIAVQMNRIFPDSKTFVDCIPKRNPDDIVKDFLSIQSNPAVKFSLKLFVEENFEIPITPSSTYTAEKNILVEEHVRRLWSVLQRHPDKVVKGSSLLPLPNAYIVPGGRFREVYYWDSYFTMLGLQESGEYSLIENMINNFSYLIQQYGFIPNGNRTYYLSRSQPPFFSLMLDLLAEKKGNSVYALYKNALQKEYDYWMDKSNYPTKHAVKMPNGTVLNRYYDQDARPRQESFYEDSTLGQQVDASILPKLYKNLRSGAESGWDFSSRWLINDDNLSTLQVTDLIPVDLNCLLYHLELTLSKAYKETGNLLQSNYYSQLAEKRKKAINTYCWNTQKQFYCDYNIRTHSLSSELTLAATYPLFFSVASSSQAKAAAAIIEKQFLKPGGVVTTLKTTGQQWDAPNGWAPLQWICIQGLENYKETTLAKEIATRWIHLNKKVFANTGKLMEKYNVENINLEAGGGEYPSQDGFGWTNGVLLKLMKLYPTQ